MTMSKVTDARWRKSSHSGSNSNCVEVAAVWRTSSYSGSNAACVEVAPAWQKSSHSGPNSNCVEVGAGGGAVAVRDSKNPDGGVLMFDGAQWGAFLGAIKNGTLDRA